MADNVPITAGSGTTIATKDISTVHHQKFIATDSAGTIIAVLEDAASAGGEPGIPIIGVRNDAAASKTSADGDWGMLGLDSAGRVGIADLGGSITVDSTLKPSYASAVDITCTMASKTSGQGRRSASVDNSSNLYDDVLVFVSLTPGTITSPASFAVYAYAGWDASNYETGGSSDADYNTLAGDEKLLGVVAITTNSTARGGWFSLAKAYGGIGNVPKSWGIIISQTNCGTLSATEGNHLKKFVGIKYLQG